MKDTPSGIASFVLRFTPKAWLDENNQPHLQWRGRIRHVQGDDETGFVDFADAVTFMQRHLMHVTVDAMEGGSTMDQEKMVSESLKLWEQFASTYSTLMFEAMERTIEQSETLKQQMDKAVGKALETWRLPAQADQAQVIEALNKLQAQVEALMARVKSLEQGRGDKVTG